MPEGMKALLVAVLAVVTLAPAVAHAQAQMPAEPLACMPSCRKGFVCVNATCVSACNPLCAAEEVCTEAAECVPRTAEPQTSIPAELIRADQDPKELRKADAWTIYGGAGYQKFKEVIDFSDIDHEDVGGISLGVGIGWRRHFTRVLGLQARGNLMALGHQGYGGGWGTSADVTLRLGPVANAFPWYVGIGPCVDLFRLSRWMNDWEGTKSAWSSNVGGVFETGFVLGERDSLDLGLRALIETSLSGGDTWAFGGQLVAGFRFR